MSLFLLAASAVAAPHHHVHVHRPVYRAGVVVTFPTL